MTKPVKIKQPIATRIDPVREDVFRNDSIDPTIRIKGPISRPQKTRIGIVSDSGISAIPAIVRNIHTTNNAHKQPTTSRKMAAILNRELALSPGASRRAYFGVAGVGFGCLAIT